MEDAKQILNLNVNDILPNRFQPRIRFNETALSELTNSIKEHGVIQPITVRPIGNKYEIVAGERRYKASVLAGKQTIPAIVVNLDDNSCAELALIENVQRQDLTPIEEAISYKKILDMGYLTQEALAIKLGKNQSTIANKLRLLNLDENVQNSLLENKISERHARSLLKIVNKNEQKQMLNRIISERLTVRRTDEEISKLLTYSTNIIQPETRKENHMNQINTLKNNQNNNDFNIPNIAPIETEISNYQTFTPDDDKNFNQGPQNNDKIRANVNSQAINPSPETINFNQQIPSPSPDELNRLIEKANKIIPEDNIPLEPIQNQISEIPQIKNNMIEESTGVLQQPMGYFNNMVQTPQEYNNNISPIIESQGPDNGGAIYNQSVNNLTEQELQPIQFFDLDQEKNIDEEKTQQQNQLNDIFNITPIDVTNNSSNDQPKVDKINTDNQLNSNQSNNFNNEFIENLEETAVNMDFQTPTTPVQANFNFNPVTPVEPIINTNQNQVFVKEANSELIPLRPSVNVPTKNINIRKVIEEIRMCAKKIEQYGFVIDTEEYDLDNVYQVVFKIDKE
ncbi:MAG: ParB/RepB/Spo0J family partition protein [Bacilli bacterium]